MKRIAAITIMLFAASAVFAQDDPAQLLGKTSDQVNCGKINKVNNREGKTIRLTCVLKQHPDQMFGAKVRKVTVDFKDGSVLRVVVCFEGCGGWEHRSAKDGNPLEGLHQYYGNALPPSNSSDKSYSATTDTLEIKDGRPYATMDNYGPSEDNLQSWEKAGVDIMYHLRTYRGLGYSSSEEIIYSPVVVPAVDPKKHGADRQTFCHMFPKGQYTNPDGSLDPCSPPLLQ